MDINNELIEKVKEKIENPNERMKFVRLYLLYKLYERVEPQKITYSKIDESMIKINARFKTYLQQEGSSDEKKEMLGKVTSLNALYKDYKGNKKRTSVDDLIYGISNLECELLLVPTFPSYLGQLLEEKINMYNRKSLVRGQR